MQIKQITIIGGGNLGVSISKGLLKLENFSYDNIVISEKRDLRIEFLKKEGFKKIFKNNKDAINDSNIIIISVKPQQMKDVLNEIKDYINPTEQIVLSTVTGFSLDEMSKILTDIPMARIMPNTAIEIKESMTCISFRNTNKDHEDTIINLFNKLGKVIVLQEDLLDAVTVLGACGIAFALRFLRAATQGGIEIGFSAELSQLIVAQTVKGAAQLILENNSHPETEIDKVTTPQGITISGLNEMEHQGFSSALIKGLLTSYNKLKSIITNNNKNI